MNDTDVHYHYAHAERTHHLPQTFCGQIDQHGYKVQSSDFHEVTCADCLLKLRNLVKARRRLLGQADDGATTDRELAALKAGLAALRRRVEGAGL